MKTRLPFVALFSLLLAGGNVSAAPFSSLYAFGDSLSDIGNSPSAAMSLYEILADNCAPASPCPPYFEGRVSNGPVATERLAESLFSEGIASARFQSYAVAGATTGIGNFGDGGTATKEGDLLPIPVPGIFPLPGMKQEVEQYMSDSGGNADPNALYFVWGGGNDFLTQDSPLTAAQNISGYVGELAAAGAQHLLVPNLPDLGQTPFARAEGMQTQAQAFSLSFNEELAIRLGEVSSQFPAVNLFQFDTYSFVNGVIANPPNYELTDVQNPCLTAAPCGDPGSHLYWDDFHPTASGHSILASAFASSVPEPGIFAMFIAGLLPLGMIGSRRRRLEQAYIGNSC